MPLIAGLSGDLWPVHPHRQDDELLSSWFVRTAHANGRKAQAFGSQVFGKRAFAWSRDLDRCANQGMIERLGMRTGSGVGELKAGMLTAYESRVFHQYNAFGNTQWVLPSVFYVYRRRRYGMQFCPLCLLFDKEPYYRRRWRLAFATICDAHGTMLHDRCPQCSAPVIFFRNDTGNNYRYRLGDLVSCWECGFDLRRARAYSPDGPDGKTIMALRSLTTFHDIGWWFHGNAPIQYGPLYFEVLHRLCHFLPTPGGRRFLNAIEHETGWRVEACRERKRCEFESRPIEYRHRLMMAVLWLLDEWPHRFVRIAKSIGITQSQINDGAPFPYWFESVLREHLCGNYYNLTETEIKSAADYLRRSGKQVSVNAVCQLLGRNNAAAVRRHVRPIISKPLDDEALRKIYEHFDAVHASLPKTSRPRLVWQRDRTILKLMQLMGWPYRRIGGLTVSNVADLSQSALDLIRIYLTDTRQHMAGADSGDALFIKWKGGHLTGESWRCRLRHYKCRHNCSVRHADAICDRMPELL